MTVDDGCFAKLQENGDSTVMRARVPQQEARSPIGSGDAFLAGYLAYRYVGKEPVEALRYAVACGAESTQHFGAGVVDPGRIGRLLEEVEVERLDVGAHVS
jgi:1-phosphofructokinase/tagatose 6-phosphate kinase